MIRHGRRVAWGIGLTLVAVGAVVGFLIWKGGRGSRAESAGWLTVWKGDGGTLHAVTADESKVTPEVVARLPARRRTGRLSAAEIRAAMTECGLFGERAVNAHLRFGDGDVRYWAEQPRPGWEVRVELLCRGLVLDLAEEKGVRIDSQGDLSYWAGKLYFVLAPRVR